MSAEKPWADVPAALAPAMVQRLPALVDEIIAAVRREVPEYDQPLEGDFGAVISRGVRVALEGFVALLGTDAELPDAGLAAQLGAAELDEGRTLDALQSAYRTGARVAWRRVVADLGGVLEPQQMYALAEAIFAYIDGLADASVAGYSAALAAREGSAQARRQELVELLVAGPVTHDALGATARRVPWRVPRALAVVACAADDPAAVARRAPEGTIAARAEDHAWLVVPDPEGPRRARRLAAALRDVPAALGPTVPAEGAPRSADRARRTLALLRTGAIGGSGAAGGSGARSGARRSGDGTAGRDGLVRAADHRLALLLAADADLVAELRAERLGPLDRLTPPARTRALATLHAFLDAHGDVSAAAAALHVHPQTVRYRLGTLREQLGDAVLDDPDARLELTLALRLSASAAA